VNIYRIKGRFKQGLFTQSFSRELAAASKEQALERIYSDFGSRHKIKRNQINIEEVVELKPEEVKDPAVLAMLK
jgi:large subunit ribosomal protein LX